MQRFIDNLRINIGLQTCVTILSGKWLHRTNTANEIMVGSKSFRNHNLHNENSFMSQYIFSLFFLVINSRVQRFKNLKTLLGTTRCLELMDTNTPMRSILSNLYIGRKNFNGPFAKNKAVQGRNSIILASSSLG